MTLRELRDRARCPQKSITTYGPTPYTELEPVLEQFDVTLEHEALPVPESQGYLTVSADGQHLGSISAAAFDELRSPAHGSPWDDETRESAYRDLLSLLTDTTFVTTDKRQLLATTREIEDRAYRVGRGTLYAGFQRLSTFREQVPHYEALVDATDVEVVVFGAPDWEPGEIPGVTIRADTAGDVTDFWIVAFDGAGDAEQKCALLVEERDPGSFTGVLTYDPEIVDDLTAYLDSVGD